MKFKLSLLLALALCSINVFAQGENGAAAAGSTPASAKPAATAITPTTAPLDLARAALAAHSIANMTFGGKPSTGSRWAPEAGAVAGWITSGGGCR